MYLRDKYHVQEAYYFLGCVDESNQDLYSALQKAGFIVMFREHNPAMKGKKKGNVDTDIVFEMMRALLDSPQEFAKVVLVSGDGDYKKVVDYFAHHNRLEKILFPNGKFASSLYNELPSKLKISMGRLRSKIEYTK